MKFKVQMKDPDTLYDAIKDAIEAELKAEGITDADEVEALSELRHEKVAKVTSKWFKYGEYLTVEVDTDAQTCVVVPTHA